MRKLWVAWWGDKTVCHNCNKKSRHIIFDWLQQLPWCRDCWKEYLTDYRDANPKPPRAGKT